jgi:Bacterial membrane protein YfhO
MNGIPPTRPTGRRFPRSNAAALVLLATAILVAHWDAASLQGLFFFEDFKHYSARMAFTAGRLRAGELPLWNPYLAFGTPHLAVWYLPGDLLFTLLPLTTAVNYAPLLHLFVGASGVYFLARSWRQSCLAATLAGLVYALGGFASAGLEYLDIVVAIAWFPWILLCAEKALRTGSGKALALGAIALGLQISGGHPQMVLLGVGCVALYGGALWASSVVSGATTLRVLASLFSLGAGLAGAFLAPFLELMAVTHRASGLNLKEAVLFSLPPEEALGLLFPSLRDVDSLAIPAVNTYGGHSIFMGILPLALASLALRRADRRRVFLLALCLLAVLVGLGRFGPFYPLLYSLPPLSWVRVPTRALWVENLACAMLAGFGLDDLLNRRADRARLLCACALAALGACLLWWSSVLSPAPLPAAARLLPASLSTLAAAAVLWLPSWRRPTWWTGAAALGVTMAELHSFNGALLINRVVPADVYDRASDSASRIRALDPSARVFQTGGHTESILAQRRGDVSYARTSAGLLTGTLPAQFSVRSSQGQVALTPGLVSLYSRMRSDLKEIPDPEASLATAAGSLGRLGVRFILSPVPLVDPAFRRISKREGIRIYENEHALSRAVFTCPTVADRATWTLSGPGPSRIGLAAPGDVDGCTGSVSIVVDDPKRIVVRQQSAVGGYLVVTDTHYPGWVATVNGRRATISPVDDLFRAVPVAPGENRVEFVYRPTSVLFGLSLSLGTALAVARMLRNGQGPPAPTSS